MEAIAIYKVLLINKITENLYKKEITEILNSDYNFDELKSKNGEMPFFELLSTMMEDKNSIVALVLNATNYRLTQQTKLLTSK